MQTQLDMHEHVRKEFDNILNGKTISQSSFINRALSRYINIDVLYKILQNKTIPAQERLDAFLLAYDEKMHSALKKKITYGKMHYNKYLDYLTKRIDVILKPYLDKQGNNIQ